VKFYNSMVANRRLRRQASGHRIEVRITGFRNFQRVLPSIRRLRDQWAQDTLLIRRVPMQHYLHMVRGYITLSIEQGLLSKLHPSGALTKKQVS